MLEDRLAPAAFSVTTADDSGPGSLRQALLDANASMGMDSITFAIGGGGAQTISPTSSLPMITGPVILDGTSQPGFAGTPLIQLDGAAAGSFVIGLHFGGGATGSTLKGLIITRFDNDGIRADGNNLTIQGNYIGTNAAGDSGLGNGGSGVGTPFGGANLIIGGDQPGQGNVVSGNRLYGLSLGSGRLMGNIIGLNPAGTARLSNGSAGLFLGGANMIVGGLTPGARNIISGNGTGVIINGAGGVTFQGNYIGLGADGITDLGNSGAGISFASGSPNIIGGPEPGARNVISGNGTGLDIFTSNNRIQGNYLGTNAAGDADVGNSIGIGVGRHGVTGNLIGGTTAAERNIISGNGTGVSLGYGPTGTIVQGNYIGLNAAGTAALPNGTGVAINGFNNLIGGASPGAGNVISGNNGSGIRIVIGDLPANRIQGNRIGSNLAGTAGIPNGGGIFLDSPGDTVGGAAPGEGNLIAFNGGSGIFINSGTGHAIRGNSIFANGALGIDLAPSGPNPNDMFDTDTGANNKQNYPVLNTVSVSGGIATVSGSLNTFPTVATYTLEFFASTAADPSGFGEGATFLTSIQVTTDSSGNVSFSIPLTGVSAPGTVITATATDANGNTSEFSATLTVGSAPVQLSAATYSVNEGAGTLTVTITRTSGDLSANVAVTYATSNGTATAGPDYTAVSGTITFASGQTSATVVVPIIDDTSFEPNETFTFALSNPTGGAVLRSPTSATVTIVENDVFSPGSLEFSAASYSVAESAGNATITVRRFDGSDGTVTVRYATSNGTAIAGQDYTASTATLTFTSGQTTASFTVPITDDTTTEGDETVNLTLSNPTGGAVLGMPSSAVLTILASDPITLKVTSFNTIPSGWRIAFNMPVFAEVLNLYDAQDVNLGPPDIVITGAATGLVRGSMVFNASRTLMYFMRTGTELPPDTYTVTLRSGAAAFRTSAGDLLDGNGDGTPGDDHVRTVTVDPSSLPVIGLPDVMRGPGQTFTLPLSLNEGTGVNRINLGIGYDPALIQFTGATLGPGVPAGSTLTFTPGTGTATLALTVAGTLPAGRGDFVILSAMVPDTAPYTSKQLLDVAVLGINGVPNAGRDDDAVEVIGYLGDTTGNAGYSSLDATRALRVAVGLDTGFGAYPQADPRIIADVTGNGILNSTDATRILQEAVGIDRPEVPALPGVIPPIVPGGPDPLLSLPRHLRGRPGQQISVPVNLDQPEGLAAVDLALSFDSTVLEVVAVRRGRLTHDFDVFAVNVDPVAGTIQVGLGRTSGPISGRRGGNVLTITFRVRADAPAGQAVVNLRRELGPTTTQLNEGGLDLNPDPSNQAGDALDGVITVLRRRNRTARS